MSARKAAAPSQKTVGELVEGLLGSQLAGKFSRTQLTKTVAKFLELYPGSEIDDLRAIGRELCLLSVTVSEPHAASLVGTESLPQLPKRTKSETGKHCMFVTVTRVRGGRMHIFIRIPDDVVGPLRQFTVATIIASAPGGPETAQAWREHLRKNIERSINFSDSEMIELVLRRPTFVRPEGVKHHDLDAAIGRFCLREGDLRNIVAIYKRHHDEALRSVLEAIEDAHIEGGDRKCGIRLVVDNTRPEVSP